MTEERTGLSVISAADSMSRLEDPVEITRVLTKYESRVRGDFWTLAALLVRAFETSAPATVGYETFQDYVEEVTGLSMRTAQRYMRIWRWRQRLIVEDELLDRIGRLSWAKLDVVVSIAEPEDAEEVEHWVGLAEENSVRKLIELSRAEAMAGEDEDGDKGGEDPIRVKRLMFAVSEDQAAAIEQAISVMQRLAEKEGRSLPRGSALALICTEFLAEHANLASDVADLAAFAARVAGFEVAVSEDGTLVLARAGTKSG